jgi:hypothetical protein
MLIRGMNPVPTLTGADQVAPLSCEQTSAGSWSDASKLRQVE